MGATPFPDQKETTPPNSGLITYFVGLQGRKWGVDEGDKQHMVTLGDSGVMIFYPGEPRITASMNGEGWKVPGIRSGPLFHAGVYGVGS